MPGSSAISPTTSQATAGRGPPLAPRRPAGDLPYAVTGQNKAYQVGVAYGNLGLVYGQTSKKNTWEARVYWQHVEQYAADVNLLDSDFFEGRANLEGRLCRLCLQLYRRDNWHCPVWLRAEH